MSERNETRYQLEQENKVFILTTSIINDKLKIKCQDSNNQIFVGEFTMNDLLKLSRYFNSTKNVEQVQLYLNGIIEKQRIGVFPEDNFVNIVLYLINKDKIYIPLLKNISNNNNIYNIENNYFQNQKENIITQALPNYSNIDNYSNQQVLENIYKQNSNQYITNVNSQPYYIEQNFSKISDIQETGGVSIQGINDFSNIGDSTNIANYNLSSKQNKSQLYSIPNVVSYPQSDAYFNNYNFQFDENKKGKLEDDSNVIRLEQENIKNEMQQLLNETTNLRKENELYKKKNASLLNENTTLKNENEEFREQLFNCQNEIKAYKDENEILKEKFNNIQNDINTYKTQDDKLLKMKEEYENNIQTLKNDLEQMNKENELLRGEIEELKHNFTIVTNENESLVNDINILRTSLAIIKKLPLMKMK